MLVMELDIHAYTNQTSDVLIDNINGTIVYADVVYAGLYWFDVQFVKPNNSSKYVIFSTVTRDDVYISTFSTDLVFEIMEGKFPFTRLDKDTYIYHDGSAPQWNISSTTVSGFTLYISANNGTNAQLIAQELLDNYLYLYVDQINTNETNVVNAFISRYYTDNYNQAYQEGYKTAQAELYPLYYWEGHQAGYELAEIIVGPEQWDAGYSAGLNANLDVKPLFQNLIVFIGTVFSLEIFPGMTIGALAIIPISFAVFKWFMKMFGGK